MSTYLRHQSLEKLRLTAAAVLAAVAGVVAAAVVAHAQDPAPTSTSIVKRCSAYSVLVPLQAPKCATGQLVCAAGRQCHFVAELKATSVVGNAAGRLRITGLSAAPITKECGPRPSRCIVDDFATPASSTDVAAEASCSWSTRHVSALDSIECSVRLIDDGPPVTSTVTQTQTDTQTQTVTGTQTQTVTGTQTQTVTGTQTQTQTATQTETQTVTGPG